ncbi:DMSO reductase [Photobacterium sanctipauli]|uniref:DMSO reductase n=1 Tax=Photobacterium sanctipauli TaxID=1342794 RepID=A0A2T3P1C1_9GAMM|nr:DMSO reductase [Photobacterium sanctipauli]
MLEDSVTTEHMATIARILGSFFYYPVNHEANLQLREVLAQDDQETVFTPVLALMDQTSAEAISSDFQTLFEGCEVMPAPPWGSVYLDKEQVIFGESTISFRAFLTQHEMSLDTGMREPEDQFGLMLLAMAQLLEEKQDLEAVKVMLGEHILPWSSRYLELVQKHADTEIYQMLAAIAEQWLLLLQEEYGIQPVEKRVYF